MVNINRRRSKRRKTDSEHGVWKWWEKKNVTASKGSRTDSKWRTLKHKGPLFALSYTPLPSNVKFLYNRRALKLSRGAEEVATFYAKMIDTSFVKKSRFNANFFDDWKKFMTPNERKLIKNLKSCDFRPMSKHFKDQSLKNKAMSKQRRQALKNADAKIAEAYGFCLVDGYKQKISNFRTEPPGLFRGRGDHPKMGRVKNRIQPEDVVINIGNRTTISAPRGHRWKKVCHDNKVAWLASWKENITGGTKYIMLNPSSKVKSMIDYHKYEKARQLHKTIGKVRQAYVRDWKHPEMTKRQRSVAIYFIDKLALRAGNEKESDSADTVGCCSLRVEHIKLCRANVVQFDFPGKDCIRYKNSVSVDTQVFTNLKRFMAGKRRGDALFDKLNTATVNKYLNTLMNGLTAKVFRTYNASTTLQQQLEKHMKGQAKASLSKKLHMYSRANRDAAILCNHQRSVPLSFDKQMRTIQLKIAGKRESLREVTKAIKTAQRSRNARALNQLKKRHITFNEHLTKLEEKAAEKEENKHVALGTSKLNYLDPRITVTW